jgi:hypothetical protein
VESDAGCAPGALVCVSERQTGVCIADGEVLPVQTCPADQVCAAGACVGAPVICSVLGFRCSGDVREQCNDTGTAWNTIEVCAFGCRPVGCDPPPVICTVGARRCAGDGLETCNAAGTAWVASPCDHGCASGACLPPPTVCAAGERRCLEDVAQVCSADRTVFVSQEICEFGCAAGVCQPPPPGTCAGASDTRMELGCHFVAVDMDQIGQRCTTNNDCGFLVGVCRPEGWCSDALALQPWGVILDNPGTVSAEVVITRGDGTEVLRRALASGTSFRTTLPQGRLNDTAIGRDRFDIRSSAAISVVQYNGIGMEDFSADGSRLWPANRLGRDYFVASTTQPSGEGGVAVGGFRGQVVIAPVQSGTTRVTVTTQGTAIVAGTGGSPLGVAADSNRVYTILEGEVLQLSTASVVGGDLTGAFVSADRDIAVFSGSECAQMPVGVPFCDHVEAQVLPLSSASRSYVLPPFPAIGNTFTYWRIVSTRDSNVVRILNAAGEVTRATLQRGRFLEHHSRNPLFVEATHPVYVFQFLPGSELSATGTAPCDRTGTPSSCLTPGNAACQDSMPAMDPSMVQLLPPTMHTTRHVLTRHGDYTSEYALILAPSSAQVQTGAGVTPATILNLGTWRVQSILLNQNRLTLVGTEPFGVIQYGLGCGQTYAVNGSASVPPAP